MKNYLKNWFIKNKYLLLILIGVFILYFPSFNVFFTNDDFFHLKISEANSLKDILNFFSFSEKPGGYGFYRPLTTQIYYYLGRSVFNLDPIYLHIISYLTFSGIIFAVYKLAFLLTEDSKTAVLTAYFYAFSAHHFAHLYYLSTYQELGVALFFLAAAYYCILFFQKGTLNYYIFTILFFVLSLLSKETAASFPGVVLFSYIFSKIRFRRVISVSKFIYSFIPILFILVLYLYLHFVVYGTPEGSYYSFDFSPTKALNTLFWYLIWTTGIPEMFLDFVGPGLRINPNLFKYWGLESKLIITIFVLFLITVLTAFVKNLRRLRDIKLGLLLFSAAWFLITLSPVLFLPMHKFAFYLTLPAFGLFLYISSILINASKNKFIILISVIIFLSLSVVSTLLSYKTHWTVRSSQIAARVYAYFETEGVMLPDNKFHFNDTPEDAELPWSPSEVVKTALSGNNFFEVFYNMPDRATYDPEEKSPGAITLPARDFLGY